METLSSNNDSNIINSNKLNEPNNAFRKSVLLSRTNSTSDHLNITNHIMHYRNVYSGPSNYLLRRIEYTNMKVYNDDYRSEANRLKSLKSYFNEKKYMDKHFKEKLARSGFFKHPEDEATLDKVKCIYCQGSLSKWNPNNDPMKEHAKYFPTCPFLLKLNVGNIPLKQQLVKKINIDSSDYKKSSGNGQILIKINIVSTDPKYRTEIHLLDVINIDWRKETFKSNDLSHIEHLALYGLYVIVRTVDGSICKSVRCYDCEKITKVLFGVEELALNLFHHVNCDSYKEVDRLMKNKNQLITEKPNSKNDNNCVIEYAISQEEISIRMDSERVHNLIENFNLEKDAVKEVIQKQLKSTCQDYGSTFQLFKDVQRFNRVPTKQLEENNILEYVIKDPCVVCMDAPVQVVSLPCGHLKTCYECSEKLLNCAVCREMIVRKVYGIRIMGY